MENIRKEKGTERKGQLFVWSKVDASNRYIPFILLETDEQTKEELEESIKRGQLWVFIADKLEGQTILIKKEYEIEIEIEIPPYFDEYKRKDLFWYNNVLETYEEAYERLKEETKKELKDYYDDDEALELEAERLVEEKLESLSIVKL
ncbi:MAG: hypothetical protein ACO2PO_09470 [Candidatus Calescibacterium sp.]